MYTMNSTVEQVPAGAWKHWVDTNEAMVLDVREPMEWAATGVLPNSERISLGSLSSLLHRLDRDTPILAVCRSGNRSQSAAQMLVQAGFRRVANLSGGLVALGVPA
jgi:rhodanese-related sulfurtransferase